ncbi:hypothetical protein ACS0PU_007112 [Formica fusca]
MTHFEIHTLGIIIFGILISNIVTKPENSSNKFDKHIELDTKENIYKTTLRNNTYITIEKVDNNQDGSFYVIWPLYPLIMIVFVILFLFQWTNTRCACDRRFIGRNYLCFSECCFWYIRKFRNTNPNSEHEPYRLRMSLYNYQSEPVNYYYVYEIRNNNVT